MVEQRTCGQGLAEHSSLPAKLGAWMAAVAEVLEGHMQALDLQDPNSTAEHAAYAELAKEHRSIAAHLQATAARMAGYRRLPMGRHDTASMADATARERFAKVVTSEREVLGLLQKSLAQDQQVLDQMAAAE